MSADLDARIRQMFEDAGCGYDPDMDEEIRRYGREVEAAALERAAVEAETWPRRIRALASAPAAPPMPASKSQARRLAVQRDLVSPCCSAAVTVASNAGLTPVGTNWYACSKCGKACDPVRAGQPEERSDG